MTVSEAYQSGIKQLRDAGNEAPAADAGVLLCFAAGVDRAYLYAYGSDILDPFILQSYHRLLDRRALGEPLQYLTGRQEFMSLPFEVGPGVLVPRQDTEILVETAISLCKRKWKKQKSIGGVHQCTVDEHKRTVEGQQCASDDHQRTGNDQQRTGNDHQHIGNGRSGIHGIPECYEGLELLDIGTGSGCIAVSLAYYLPGCKVTAVDKMPDALEIAKRNAVLNRVSERVEFLGSNLFESVAGRKFDAIVSNPPYIRTADIEGLQREVRCHEPMAALDGGADGLDFYRIIAGKAPEFLQMDGILAFETAYNQAEEVAALMSDHFSEIAIFRDLAGIERVVAGIWSEKGCLYTKSNIKPCIPQI